MTRAILDSPSSSSFGAFGKRFSYETAENVPRRREIIEELNDAEVRLVVVVSDWLMPEVKGDGFWPSCGPAARTSCASC
ncbi:MAG: hypothetical protein R3A48_10845 [Polyangiales bacterium]